MPLPVVSVPNGLPVTSTPVLYGLPVVVATNGFGIGVTPVASGGLGVFDTSGTLFGPPVIPANTSPPVIAPTPTPVVGNTLTLSSLGTWSGTMATYAYQWKRGGVNISGATAISYLLVTADLAANITVTVTATNPAGSASATSAAVGPVLVAAPVNSALPVITGSTAEGGVLTTTTGTWSGSPTYAYQWKRGVTNVGTNVNTYTSVVGDVGSNITVVVTATNAGGNASATSAAVGPITAAPADIAVLTLVLDSTSDSGTSSSDGVTNITTPQINITFSIAPLANDTIDVMDGVTFLVSHVITADEISGNTIALGLSALSSGAHSITARHTRSGTSGSYSSALVFTIDAVAPTLSSASGVQATGTTATLAVTTNDATGTLYVVATLNSSTPSKAQVKAGQDASGSAAVYSSNQVISSTGAKSATATSISTTATYYCYWMHEDLAGNQSSVTSASWAHVTGGSPVYVTGDRRSSITVTKTASIPNGGGTLPALVDGSFTNSAGPPGSWYWNATSVDSADQLIFDFGAGNTKLVTEAKWYQDTAASHGVWQWYGSTDAVTASVAIGSSFTLAGVAGAFTMTTLNGNTTAYRAYILQGVSGSTSPASYEQEIEFKQL